MRRICLTLLGVLVMVGCTTEGSIFGTRGSGTMTSESREVSDFTTVVLEGSGTVNISVDGTESLTIEAEDNLMPLLTSEVSGGTLTLGTSASISPTREIVYTLSAASLDGVKIEGSGSIDTGGISADSFSADITGSGAITLDEMDVQSLDASISGSGDIDVAGTSPALDVSIPGSGSFDGESLEAATATVRISGSGHAVVNASDTLDAGVSGSGSIEYVGSPQVSSDISGSGSIKPR